MRHYPVRCTLRSLLAFVAVAGLLFAADRLWRRAEHYRRQAALCAYFELASQKYADDAETWDDATVDEKKADVAGNLAEARESGRHRRIYVRIAQHPWEVLPADTPSSVNPWDLESASTSYLEETVAELRKTHDTP
jgi:hypothetical protein